MCDICRQVPCHPRCPNAPAPRGVHTCKYCGEPIIAGEKMWELEGDHYHDDCIDDMTSKELLDKVFHITPEYAQGE